MHLGATDEKTSELTGYSWGKSKMTSHLIRWAGGGAKTQNTGKRRNGMFREAAVDQEGNELDFGIVALENSASHLCK